MLALFAFSCFSNISKDTNECKGLKKFVKNRWMYNKEGDYYREGVGLLGLKGKYRKCIIGMPKPKVIKLFGKPSDEDKNRNEFYYFTTPYWKDASNKSNRQGSWLVFIFDKDGKVSNFSFGGVIVSPSH